MMVAVLITSSFSACSKSDSRDGGRFSVAEPPVLPQSPAHCDPSIVGDLEGYSIYVKEVAHLNDVSVGGRVAAGESHMRLGRIGMALSPDKSRADFQVSRTLHLIGTSTPNGQTTYGTRFDNVNSAALGGFMQKEFDIDHGFEKLIDFSRGCDSVSPNTTVTRSCGKDLTSCVLRITGTESLNIADISSEDLRHVRKIQVKIPAGAKLVTNFGRISAANFVSVDIEILKPGASGVRGKVYWNFPSAVELHFQDTEFHGTVVAPDARVNVHSMSGTASFWSLDLGGTQSSW